MTLPLCSYGQTFLRFWYYASLVTAAEILKKNLRSPRKHSKGLTEECLIFTALATLHGQLSLFFGEVEQHIKIFRSVEKKCHQRRKVQENDNVLMKHFPFLSPNFI